LKDGSSPTTNTFQREDRGETVEAVRTGDLGKVPDIKRNAEPFL